MGCRLWGRTESDTTEATQQQQDCQSFSSKKKASFNFMAAVTVHSGFGVQENEICNYFHFFFPSICHEVMGLDAMIFVF